MYPPASEKLKLSKGAMTLNATTISIQGKRLLRVTARHHHIISESASRVETGKAVDNELRFVISETFRRAT